MSFGYKKQKKNIEAYHIDDLENNIRVASQKILHSVWANTHEIRVGKSLKA